MNKKKYDMNGYTLRICFDPAYFDFAGEMLEGVSVVDSAVIVVSSTMTVGTEKAWEFATSRNIPRVIFVNKMHDENADFDKEDFCDILPSVIENATIQDANDLLNEYKRTMALALIANGSLLQPSVLNCLFPRKHAVCFPRIHRRQIPSP